MQRKKAVLLGTVLVGIEGECDSMEEREAAKGASREGGPRFTVKRHPDVNYAFW